jgi:hypothetical protein
VRRTSLLLPALAACALAASCESSEPKQSDLARQPDRWVTSIRLDPDSTAQYIGKTQDFLITSVSRTRVASTAPTIRIGDEIEGIRIGAIQCSFHWNDSSYGGEQYMWRGRWGCMAGRDEQQVRNAVDDDGGKRFDYIHVAPVTLR